MPGEIKQGDYKIRDLGERRTGIIIPGEKGRITFTDPFTDICDSYYQHAGPTYSEEVRHAVFARGYCKSGQGVLRRGLTIASAEQMADLLHAVYFGPQNFREDPRVSRINGFILNQGTLFIYNRNLWTPEGVYVVPDPDVIGFSERLNQNELEKRLSQEGGILLSKDVRSTQDGSVRFAPKGSYRLGEHTPTSWAKDGFVIATFGERGAEKTAEVARKLYDPSPFLCGEQIIDNPSKPRQKVSGVMAWRAKYLILNGRVGSDDQGFFGCACGVLDEKREK